jgi:hypothetical protein
MAQLSYYGPTIAAVTTGVRSLVAAAVSPTTVTARHPSAVGAGPAAASVNLFLYQDDIANYRVSTHPDRSRRDIGAELHYLVTAYPTDETDTDAGSQVLYGNARAAIENNPVLTVLLPSGTTRQVRLTTTTLGIAEHTALWIASAAPLRLSFVVSATVELPPSSPPAPHGGLVQIERLAAPGVIAVLSGPDAAAKPAAAAAIAAALGQSLLTVELEQIVSKYIGETEKNLARLFSRAEDGGAILFFDEADALFGTRTEITDAHNHFAAANPARILDLLARAPGLVLIAVVAAGEALTERRAIDASFPPLP